MIINKVNYDLSHVKLPTLAEAKKLCEKFEQPYNGTILVMGIKAPKQTKKGISIPDGVQKQIQQKIQEEGSLIVNMCESLKDLPQFKGLKVGDYVRANITNEDIRAGMNVKDKNEQEFGAIIVPSYCVVVKVKKPNYV